MSFWGLKSIFWSLFTSIVVHAGVFAILMAPGSWTADSAIHDLVHIDFLEGSRLKDRIQKKPVQQLVSKGRKPENQVQPEESPSGSVSQQASTGKTAPYIAKIVTLLNTYKIYPDEAINRKLEGKVIVRVTLNSDGSIKNLELQRKTIFDVLNQAALQSVSRIQKFPPPPGAEFTFLAPIHFKIKH